VRICLVYDCLFPYTVGGAERWYRNLALRLAEDGHDVTYVTLRQWPRGERPELEGVEIVEAGPRMPLYGPNGNRRIAPPLVFGAGVLGHLMRRGRRYDVVHTCSFPYFSLLAAAAVRRAGRYAIVVDWFELWSAAYWREYLGPVGGRAGRAVQGACLRVRQKAFCFARMTAERLRADGLRGEVTVLEGMYESPPEPHPPAPAEPLVVFAGRHIPEKRAPAVVPAVAVARADMPELRGVIFGDGPERGAVLDAIARSGMQGIVEAPGFVESERVESTLARALCMVLPSRREGYGMIVVEASAAGVPSVVVRDPDNAAVELVQDGVNGFVAESAAPEAIAAAILRVHEAGPALRDSTVKWFASHKQRLSLRASLAVVAQAYAASARA
jgi:glycosyltransferase involved in cell wall biosynthesis